MSVSVLRRDVNIVWFGSMPVIEVNFGYGSKCVFGPGRSVSPIEFLRDERLLGMAGP